jgi:hypothetical protein
VEQAEEVGEMRWIRSLVDVRNRKIDEILNLLRQKYCGTLFILPLACWWQIVDLFL